MPHVPVHNASLLDVKPFFRPEHTVTQDWRSENVSKCLYAVDSREPGDTGILLSLPFQTAEQHGIAEELGLNGDLKSEAERPSSGGRPSPFRSALLQVQKRLYTFSDMVIGSLLEAWQSGPTPLGVPLGAVVFTTFTAIEILLFLGFAWRSVHTVKTPVLEGEDETSLSRRKLLAEQGKIRKLQERVEQLQRGGAALERQKLQLEAQVEAVEERLQVVDQLCREKDSSLQQKLIQDQADRQEMETVLNTYKLRIQELRQEKLRNERSYRCMIEYHQRRVCEISMKASTLEQCLEQERRETGRLCQLLAIGAKLTQFQLSADTWTSPAHLSLTTGTDFSTACSQPSPTNSPIPDLATPLLTPAPAESTSLIGQTPALATPPNRSLPLNLG